ncbi:hypothetical protein COEREDRAFT_8814 [Coemansia reversa NRRL 1564]|uniref:Uncharacterized protein n=1 Tax=Coemansia reversa (strain ATCC 12441 / NRRL 1564) TaxID=763665 RepID=A0A2G5BBR8_COERN|nr:hypothetical protein COEREDRAFT_8814 [Coemansia reversa NRRL 1564]|eukprot:PIA16157.1 hypothetical protein COEREDRAFT_8814 [Coemansia reversa NRRL 1564]
MHIALVTVVASDEKNVEKVYTHNCSYLDGGSTNDNMWGLPQPWLMRQQHAAAAGKSLNLDNTSVHIGAYLEIAPKGASRFCGDTWIDGSARVRAPSVRAGSGLFACRPKHMQNSAWCDLRTNRKRAASQACTFPPRSPPPLTLSLGDACTANQRIFSTKKIAAAGADWHDCKSTARCRSRRCLFNHKRQMEPQIATSSVTDSNSIWAVRCRRRQIGGSAGVVCDLETEVERDLRINPLSGITAVAEAEPMSQVLHLVLCADVQLSPSTLSVNTHQYPDPKMIEHICHFVVANSSDRDYPGKVIDDDE